MRVLWFCVCSVRVPISVWWPDGHPVRIGWFKETQLSLELQLQSGSANSPSPHYEYAIDAKRVASNLRSLARWVGWAGKRTFQLPRGRSVVREINERRNEALIFTHGTLGSRFDMAHLCERLAADGFVVFAPELPESLAASYTLPPQGSFSGGGKGGGDVDARPDPDLPEVLLIREAILRATRSLLPQRVEWGVFGHSAGGIHAQAASKAEPGAFALGRVSISPSFGPGNEEYYYFGQDPLLVVASEGDGCYQRMVRDERQPLRLAGMIDTLLDPIETFMRPEKAYQRELVGPEGELVGPKRAAFVFERSGGPAPAPLPSHVSYLWEPVLESLLSFAGPLIPLGKLLRLYMYDLEIYKKKRDADATARVLLPLIRRFFVAWKGGVPAQYQRTGRMLQTMSNTTARRSLDTLAFPEHCSQPRGSLWSSAPRGRSDQKDANAPSGQLALIDFPKELTAEEEARLNTFIASQTWEPQQWALNQEPLKRPPLQQLPPWAPSLARSPNPRGALQPAQISPQALGKYTLEQPEGLRARHDDGVSRGVGLRWVILGGALGTCAGALSVVVIIAYQMVRKRALRRRATPLGGICTL